MNQDEIKKKIVDFCMFYEPTNIIHGYDRETKQLLNNIKRFEWKSANISYRHTHDTPFLITLWLSSNSPDISENCPKIILKPDEGSHPIFQFPVEDDKATAILNKWYVSPTEARIKKILHSYPFQQIPECLPETAEAKQ